MNPLPLFILISSAEVLSAGSRRSAGIVPIFTFIEKGGGSMNELVAFWKEEDGVAVVEIVLILVVLIALVLVFKDRITSVLKGILDKVEKQSGRV